MSLKRRSCIHKVKPKTPIASPSARYRRTTSTLAKASANEDFLAVWQAEEIESMETYLQQLTSIGSSPLCSSKVILPEGITATDSNTILQWLELLELKNGFFAFESALHVFPVGDVDFMSAGYDFWRWNSPELWRDHFSNLPASLLFFAEDVFGCQWGLTENEIIKFDPETGTMEKAANTMEEWAQIILSDYRVETGWPLAHEWHQRNGPLAPNHRLVPITLFCLGGQFILDNFYSIDAVEGMNFRADIARQLKDLPYGTQVRIVISDATD